MMAERAQALLPHELERIRASKGRRRHRVEVRRGPGLARELNQGAGDKLAVWRQGRAAVQWVNSRDECLSQAFARNFIVTPRGIAAINHDENPIEVASLPQAQSEPGI